MSNISYMVRDDWAQRGTSMEANSAIVRNWLGPAPHIFAVPDPRKLAGDRTEDSVAAGFIVPDPLTGPW